MRAENRTTLFVIPLWDIFIPLRDRTTRMSQRSYRYRRFVFPHHLQRVFRESQIQIGIKIVKLLAPVSTALNQTRRLAFLSMILSESRFPLFGIMLQHPVAFRSSLKRVLQCLSNFGKRLLSARVRESKTDGRSVMAAAVSDYLPHQNPCAQCGHPIAAPVWFEHEPRRTTYLWQCASCGYRFEAVAFFAESKGEPNAIAA